MVTDSRPVPFRWTFYIGKDGKILKVDKKVRAGQDGANAAKTLKELGVAAMGHRKKIIKALEAQQGA